MAVQNLMMVLTRYWMALVTFEVLIWSKFVEFESITSLLSRMRPVDHLPFISMLLGLQANNSTNL
jgi:hypothetical protein